MYKISVIIPTYNRAQYIGLTIESFLRQTYPRECIEILICDNHSTDDTKAVVAKIIQDYKEYSIRYLYEDRQGVHYTRNTAAKQAVGDILYFTDDDMIADSYMLERLVAVFEQYENIGAATGKVIPKWEKTPPDWVKKYLSNQWLSLLDKKMELCIAHYDFGVYSCHEAIKRDIFMKTGGFHPENTAGEWVGDGETGFNMEVQNMGYSFAYVGDAVTEHIIPSTRMTQDYLNKRFYNQGCSDSYTAYRIEMEQGKHFKATKGKYFGQLLKQWVKTFFRICRKKESYHFFSAYWNYYKARTEYDLRIVRDSEWRKMIIRKNWL